MSVYVYVDVYISGSANCLYSESVNYIRLHFSYFHQHKFFCIYLNFNVYIPMFSYYFHFSFLFSSLPHSLSLSIRHKDFSIIPVSWGWSCLSLPPPPTSRNESPPVHKFQSPGKDPSSVYPVSSQCLYPNICKCLFPFHILVYVNNVLQCVNSVQVSMFTFITPIVMMLSSLFQVLTNNNHFVTYVKSLLTHQFLQQVPQETHGVMFLYNQILSLLVLLIVKIC